MIEGSQADLVPICLAPPSCSMPLIVWRNLSEPQCPPMYNETKPSSVGRCDDEMRKRVKVLSTHQTLRTSVFKIIPFADKGTDAKNEGQFAQGVILQKLRVK